MREYVQKRESCKSSGYGWIKMNDNSSENAWHFKESDSRFWQKDQKIRSEHFFGVMEDFMKTVLYYVIGFFISYKTATLYRHEESQLV